MNVALETGPDWGKVKVGGTTFDARNFVIVAGVALWLGMLVINTGGHAIRAVTDSAIFMGFVLVVTLVSRSIPLQLIASMFLMGGFMMGLAVVAAKLAHAILPNDVAGAFCVPVIEEFLFVLPGLWFLWRRRKYTAWELGASDIMLVFAALGCGFAMAEFAWIENLHRGSFEASPVPFMTMVMETGDRIHGTHISNAQNIWGALAGISIGIASLFRGKPWWKTAAFSGIFLGWFDHFTLNYGVNLGFGSSNPLLVFSNVVVAQGHLATYLCFVGIIACALLDAYAVYFRLPRNMRPTASRFATVLSTNWWTLVYYGRRLGYSYFRAANATGFQQERAVEVHGNLRYRVFVLNERIHGGKTSKRATSEPQLPPPDLQSSSDAPAASEATEPEDSAAHDESPSKSAAESPPAADDTGGAESK